jgi:hypothetical protein
MLKLLFRICVFMLLALIAAEVFFRFVIPAADRSLSKQEPKYGIMISDSVDQRDGINTVGRFGYPRIRWHVNNYGWLYPFNYAPPSLKRKPVIAVIGDSYIEGYHIQKGEHVATVLQKQLNDHYEVYSFGASGTALSDYLNIARYANENFAPDIYIVVVQERDLHDSVVNYSRAPRDFQIQYADGRFTEVPVTERYRSKPIKRLLRRSKFLCYLMLNRQYSGLEDLGKRQIMAALHPGRKVEVIPEDDQLDQAAANDLVNRFHSDFPGKTVLFVVDGLRKDIEITNQSVSIPEATFLTKACRDSLEYVLDLAPVFTADYRAHHQLFNFSSDYHWNSYGHRVVAVSVFTFLREHDITR